MESAYHEIMDILDINYFAASTNGCTFSPRIYEISDFLLLINSLLPNEIKVNVTIDDITLKSNLTTNTTSRFIKKQFFTQY